MTGAIRVVAAMAVIGVAAIAAVISYRHAYTLAVGHGESGTTAALVPVTADGLLLVAGLVMLDSARRGVPAPALARLALALGIMATIAANLAHGLAYGVVGALVAAWPAVTLILTVELLMGMIRRAQAAPVGVPDGTLAAEVDEPERWSGGPVGLEWWDVLPAVATTRETGPEPPATTGTAPGPVATTRETGPEPPATTETAPAPVATTRETAPAPVATTRETAPGPVATTRETAPAPVATTRETAPGPVATAVAGPDDLAEVLATARARFAEMLATGGLPSVRALRRELRVGHPRAVRVRAALQAESARESAPGPVATARENTPEGGVSGRESGESSATGLESVLATA